MTAPRLLRLPYLAALLLASTVSPCQAGAAPAGAGLTPVTVQLQWRHQWEFAGF